MVLISDTTKDQLGKIYLLWAPSETLRRIAASSPLGIDLGRFSSLPLTGKVHIDPVETSPGYPNHEQIDRVAVAILAAGFASEEDDEDEDFPYNMPHALNEVETRALRQFWAENDSR